MLSSLVFTIIVFEISLSQAPEKQYSSIEKFQICKIFPRLHPPQALQLNDSSLRSQNNSKPSPWVRLLKPTMWSGRHFIFNVFHLTILHLLIVSKITIQQSFYRLFPTLLCKQFKLEWPWTKKLKLKHLHAVFAMLWLLGILKISGFVFVRI